MKNNNIIIITYLDKFFGRINPNLSIRNANHVGYVLNMLCVSLGYFFCVDD